MLTRGYFVMSVINVICILHFSVSSVQILADISSA